MERARRSSGADLLQPWPDTAEDRYPELFDDLAARLSGLESPRILSFGCSTGAEVRALRARMPGARITGIDINARSVRIARQGDRHPLSVYRVAGAPLSEDRFDAVLALAVLRHGSLGAAPESCAALLPFERVARTVGALDAVLEDGGWLAIWNAHFSLRDMPVWPRYTDSGLRLRGTAGQSPIYGPDDRLCKGREEHAVVFRKTG